MTRICLFLYSVIFLVCASLQTNTAVGQSISFQPVVDGHYLDFYVTDSGQTILLTTQGSYILNQKETFLITALDSLRLERRLQSGYEQPILYPLNNGSMAHLNKDGQIDVLDRVDRGIYLKYANGDSWKIADKIYFKTKEENQLAYKLFQQYNPDVYAYTDGFVHHQVIWLATEDRGLISAEKPMGQSEILIKEYRQSGGLFSDSCTALSRNGSTRVYVGHYGGISSIGEFQLDLSQHTLEAITQIVVDGDFIYCLAKDALIKISPDLTAQKMALPVSAGESLLKMTIRADKSLMVLSEESVHIVPQQAYVQEKIANTNAERPLQYYEVRNNRYYTDGVSVYGYNPQKQEWEKHKGKKAPAHIVAENEQVKLLFSDGRGLVLASDSAQVLRRINSDKTNLLDVTYSRGQEFHLTGDGLYRKDKIGYTMINADRKAFYKHISGNEEYLLSADAIYTMTDSRLELVLQSGDQEGYPFSQNQFAADGHLVTFTRKGLVVLDMEDNRPSIINMAPITILDIAEKQDDIWLLTPKSLVALDKRKALSGEKIITRVLPLHQTIGAARLYNIAGDQLVIASNSSLIDVDLNGSISSIMDQMDLVYVTTKGGRHISKEDGVFVVKKKDLPMKLNFASTNYYDNKAKYSYHLNYKGENSSEWSNTGEYNFEAQDGGHYTLVAKYVDDVYGVKYTTDPILIQVLEETVEATTETVSTWRLPLILISLLLLWFGWWLKGKMTI